MRNTERLFPLLAIGVAIVAYYQPEPLLHLKSSIVPLLITIMFSMGLTLSVADFQRIWQRPQPIALGILLQFGFMPFIAWALAQLLALPPEIAIGLIIVGACAGGTASNVMTFIARGDVALSVTMTTASTLWGVFLTPFLIAFYAQEFTQELAVEGKVDVDTWAMLLMIAKIVILPVAAGVLINRLLPSLQARVLPFLPSVASAAILLIIAVIVAINAESLNTLSLTVVVAIVLHNLLGFLVGYAIARWNGSDSIEARTIAIEVGMQNSGLGVALANGFFTPLSALPGALFSIWQNMAGAVLAAIWKHQSDCKQANQDN